MVVDACTETMVPRKKPYTNVVNFVYELVQVMSQGLDQEKVAVHQRMLKDRLMIVYPDEEFMDNGMDISVKKIMTAYSAGRLKFHDFLFKNLDRFNQILKS